MRPLSGILGILQPVGGGDPIPLTKPEMIVGRRPGCDIRLDYENISGKHCSLRFLNGLWMVKDLGSTNGTTVNGSPLASEQSLMPDEELGIAGHMFTIEYEPAGPEAFLSAHKDLDEEVVQERPAALAHGSRRPRHRRRQGSQARNSRSQRHRARLGRRGRIRRRGSRSISSAAPKPKKQPTDDDFFKLIEDDVKKPE